MKDREGLHIGEMAKSAAVGVDTVRYYERLGLLSPPHRTEGGFRLYSEADLGRLLFIRRAKLLGLSLDEIRGLLGIAEEGECRPLRRRVAELLTQKLDECEVRLGELAAFRESLEERRRLVLEHQDEPACTCAEFPASCSCLPVQAEELARDTHRSGRGARSLP